MMNEVISRITVDYLSSDRSNPKNVSRVKAKLAGQTFDFLAIQHLSTEVGEDTEILDFDGTVQFYKDRMKGRRLMGQPVYEDGRILREVVAPGALAVDKHSQKIVKYYFITCSSNPNDLLPDVLRLYKKDKKKHGDNFDDTCELVVITTSNVKLKQHNEINHEVVPGVNGSELFKLVEGMWKVVSTRADTLLNL